MPNNPYPEGSNLAIAWNLGYSANNPITQEMIDKGAAALALWYDDVDAAGLPISYGYKNQIESVLTAIFLLE